MEKQTLRQKVQKIIAIFKRKSPKYYVDEVILSSFDHDTVNNESKINFNPSIERLGKTTTGREILDDVYSVKLPLMQALDVVIELVLGNEDLLVDGYHLLILLSDKTRLGSRCALHFYHPASGIGRLKLRVVGMESNHKWSTNYFILRNKTKNSVELVSGEEKGTVIRLGNSYVTVYF